ncbi:ABC transporter ATP-binding protein [Halomonas shantousis]
MSLHIENLTCHYGTNVAVREATFSLAQDSIGCLLGPSGSGKTTLLRAVAGFEKATRGSIHLADRLLSSPDTHMAPERRHVGMVFQHHALFPHLTVADNVAFGLPHLPRRQRQSRTDELLELTGLSRLARRFPHQLSGGQQQRVALARALAPRPRLLLLDEPFSSLDAELRRQLSQEVRHLLKQLGIATLMVTHDQHEAFATSDWIGVLNKGCLEQWDTPLQLYQSPMTRFVARFIGQGDFLPGIMDAQGGVATELGTIATTRAQGFTPGTEVEVLLRPENIVWDSLGSLQGTIETCCFNGATIRYRIRLPSSRQFEVIIDSRHPFMPGDRLSLRLDICQPVMFKR